jgi:ATP-dependent RNA helicase DeaD
MKAIKNRIRVSVLNAAEAVKESQIEGEDLSAEIQSPESVSVDSISDVSPAIAQLGKELGEKLGAEKAVLVLLSMAYGEQLDSSRYGTVAEIPEIPLREERTGKRASMRHNDPVYGPKSRGKGMFKKAGNRHENLGKDTEGVRLYVGLGRRHGANARDVAFLLCKAGGVPGRIVDAIEMKDFCAFATMPADAAKRACAFVRKSPDDPVIRFST